ncbi:MAG: hypothetical protein ABI972_09320 [Acidobacteriota bacterium]
MSISREPHSASIPDFKLLFESAPGLYLALTPEFHIAAGSDAYLRATMTQREQLLGRLNFDVFDDNPDEAGATGVCSLRESLETARTTRQTNTMSAQKFDIPRPAPLWWRIRRALSVSSSTMRAEFASSWPTCSAQRATKCSRPKAERARRARSPPI